MGQAKRNRENGIKNHPSIIAGNAANEQFDPSVITDTYFDKEVVPRINYGLCWEWAYLAYLHTGRNGVLCMLRSRISLDEYGPEIHAVLKFGDRYYDSASTRSLDDLASWKINELSVSSFKQASRMKGCDLDHPCVKNISHHALELKHSQVLKYGAPQQKITIADHEYLRYLTAKAMGVFC